MGVKVRQEEKEYQVPMGEQDGMGSQDVEVPLDPLVLQVGMELMVNQVGTALMDSQVETAWMVNKALPVLQALVGWTLVN